MSCGINSDLINKDDGQQKQQFIGQVQRQQDDLVDNIAAEEDKTTVNSRRILMVFLQQLKVTEGDGMFQNETVERKENVDVQS